MYLYFHFFCCFITLFLLVVSGTPSSANDVPESYSFSFGDGSTKKDKLYILTDIKPDKGWFKKNHNINIKKVSLEKMYDKHDFLFFITQKIQQQMESNNLPDELFQTYLHHMLKVLRTLRHHSLFLNFNRRGESQTPSNRRQTISIVLDSRNLNNNLDTIHEVTTALSRDNDYECFLESLSFTAGLSPVINLQVVFDEQRRDVIIDAYHTALLESYPNADRYMLDRVPVVGNVDPVEASQISERMQLHLSSTTQLLAVTPPETNGQRSLIDVSVNGNINDLLASETPTFFVQTEDTGNQRYSFSRFVSSVLVTVTESTSTLTLQLSDNSPLALNPISRWIQRNVDETVRVRVRAWRPQNIIWRQGSTSNSQPSLLNRIVRLFASRIPGFANRWTNTGDQQESLPTSLSVPAVNAAAALGGYSQ